jgi:MoxR-like ATPase
MTDEEQLSQGADGAEKPLSDKIMDADSMAANAGMKQALEQQDKAEGRDTPPGPTDPSATPTSATAVDAVSLVGANAVNQLEQIFEQRNQSFDNQVTIQDVGFDIGRIEILNNENNAPTYMVISDAEGKNITTSFCTTILGIPADDDRLTTEIGESAFRYGEIIRDSLASAGNFSDGLMGAALDTILESFISTYSSGSKRKQLGDTLKRVRSLSSALGNVFAFDDYRHLEVFMAAWLMKDSTCRLSGVPGTGKTTVIECAATLLSNSYGFNTSMRIVPPQDYLARDVGEIFNGNNSSDNIYSPTLLPAGQEYSIIYGNAARPEINDLWESWRFTPWMTPKGANGNHTYAGVDASQDPNQRMSGAYLYDFKFLQPNTTFPKLALQPETFKKLLLQHYYVDVPVNTLLSDPETWPKFNEAGLAIIPEGVAKKRLVKPVKICNADGTSILFPNQCVFESGAEGVEPLIMKLANPDMDGTAVRSLFNDISAHMATVSQASGRSVVQQYIAQSGLEGMWTDAGRNEGYWLREFLQHTCFDSRATPGSLQWKSLSSEMLGEIGIAKVDFEKRADEVLYGMEIRETQSFDPAKGANVNTFDFEPVPRPIVTQPIKFFNEANRSKPGMEDAILGLIAERKVEYRGKEFDSPNFVAWMDTNPHQKGNDLAFTDRIDMEILFKSVSMGGRYNILSNRAGRPVEQLIKNLTMSNALAPLRFYEIRDIWGMIEDDATGISMVQNGGSYDGYRDVSAISVLFSQAYRTRQHIMPVGSNQTYSWVSNPHEAPLIDFSTTTNTTSGTDGTEAAVLGEGTEAFAGGNAKTSADSLKGNNVTAQLPSIFTRVLGFRFTNSIIKLAKSFAFLRGKSYVSREDIVDAIPYTVAHRIGRSKEGLTDVNGNTKGIGSAVSKDLAYNSEQDFLREFLVRGYINREVNIGQGIGASLLEMLDSFYERCVSILQSSDYAHEYETAVLKVMQTQMIGNANLTDQITPVHWHIATMVSESERMGNTMLRTYGDNNTQGYPEMYENYMQRISNPVSGNMGESCLNDMYATRFAIANDGNLFTDDKARLLGLCDEEISIYAAGLSGVKSAYFNSEINEAAVGPNLSSMGIKANLTMPTYGDTLGAWAAITSKKSDFDTTIAGVSKRLSGLAITSSHYTDDSSHIALSNQQVKLIGRIKDGVLGGDSPDYGRFHESLTAFTNKMSAKISSDNGRWIFDASSQSGSVEVSFNQFMKVASDLVKLDEDNQSYNGSRVFSMAGQDESINWGDPNNNSLMACFRLPHSELSDFISGDITQEVGLGGETREITRPARSTVNDNNINMWADDENDFLRLWICLRSIPASTESGAEGVLENQAVPGSTKYMTFILSVSVTSNFGEYHPMQGGAIVTTPGQITGTINFLPMDDPRCYSRNSVGSNGVGDAGNITKSDRQEYLGILGDALQPRSR